MTVAAQDTPNPQLPLKPAELYIMLMLAERTAHGYGIMQAIATRSNGNIRMAPGTLYTTLKRLRQRGWISEVSVSDDVPPEDDDERRRYYSLTAHGHRLLQAQAECLSEIVDMAREIGLLAHRQSAL